MKGYCLARILRTGSLLPIIQSVKGIVLPEGASYGGVFHTHATASGVNLTTDKEKAAHVLTTERGRVYLNSKPLSQDEFVANWL